MPTSRLTGFCLLLLIAPSLSAQPAADPRQAEEFFEKRVRPVLAEKCVSCHGPEKQKGGVRLDRRDAVLGDHDGDPIVVPGHPEKSLLLRVVRHEGEVKMPPKGKLAPEAVADLALWVQHGAAWPADRNPAAQAKDPRGHWAFRPVQKPALPVLKQPERVGTPVDAFILAALDAKGIQSNPPADRRTLLRRLKYDLLGLPATYDEVRAFEQDTAPDAYARLVERYLASPHYGERWARHWLDVARYADTKGYVFREERRYPYAYAYRDYVVRAFNDDLPYDQFVLQQLAADRLVALKQAPVSAQGAMGFLTLGRRFLNNQHDIIDDRLDVVSRGLMALTVACARCHDHKYDPIPQKDYYSLYGVFASSVEPADLPILAPPEPTPEFLAFDKKAKELEQAVTQFRDQHRKELDAGNRKYYEDLVQLQKKLDVFRATSKFAPPRGMILADGAIHEPHVFLRGNPGNVGPQVPRQFLSVLTGPERKPFKQGSGRLELARAIASPTNPLTARVLVNRVWLHHFGAGLVTTPSDFGLRSEPPSHPELLDYLAARFVEDGWSLKKLHRLIVLSNTYQESSADHPQAAAFDPENRLLARANRRRVDFEGTRDALLSAAGQLDPKVGGAAVELTTSPFTHRRTLYGFIDRQNLPGLFRTFDFANPDATNPQRFRTSVPQQALFLLNNPFVHEQARHLLTRPEIAAVTEPTEKIRALYRTVLAREATPDEVSLGQRFVSGAIPGPGLTPWERYGQVLLLGNEFFFVD